MKLLLALAALVLCLQLTAARVPLRPIDAPLAVRSLSSSLRRLSRH
jgi:hypothetical protein